MGLIKTKLSLQDGAGFMLETVHEHVFNAFHRIGELMLSCHVLSELSPRQDLLRMQSYLFILLKNVFMALSVLKLPLLHRIVDVSGRFRFELDQ